MERLGLHGGDMLLLEADEEGAIVLRPTGIYPLEIYSDRRVAEFAEADELTLEERGLYTGVTLGSDRVSSFLSAFALLYQPLDFG